MTSLARDAAPVVLTGAQLPGWSRLSAVGVAEPYPSGVKELGGERTAHNGTLVVPPDARTGVPVDEVSAYAWTGSAWREVPVQVDERFPSAGVVVHGAVLREELVRLVGAAQEAARRDPLTGLANRLLWQEELDRLSEQVEVGGQAAVLVLDLNGLKAVNDAHGHEAGDAYLRTAADALRRAARDEDVVARLGGDEFGVLVPGAGPELVERLLVRIREALAAAPPVHGAAVSAAVGSATCPPRVSLRAAFAEADRAMYADKQARRQQD